jgi:hypothetical protein
MCFQVSSDQKGVINEQTKELSIGWSLFCLVVKIHQNVKKRVGESPLSNKME